MPKISPNTDARRVSEVLLLIVWVYYVRSQGIEEARLEFLHIYSGGYLGRGACSLGNRASNNYHGKST